METSTLLNPALLEKQAQRENEASAHQVQQLAQELVTRAEQNEVWQDYQELGNELVADFKNSELTLSAEVQWQRLSHYNPEVKKLVAVREKALTIIDQQLNLLNGKPPQINPDSLTAEAFQEVGWELSTTERNLLFSISHNITQKNLTLVKKNLNALRANMADAPTFWGILEGRQLIDKEFLQNSEFLMAFHRVGKWVEAVEDKLWIEGITGKEAEAIRAYCFTEAGLLSAGPEAVADPSIVADWVKGNYAAHDPWFHVQLIENYGKVSKETAKHMKLGAKLKKAVGLLVLGTILSQVGPSLYHKAFTGSEKLPPPLPDETQTTEESGQEEEEAEENSEEKEPHQGRQNNPENSGELSDEVVWELSGDVPDGYFRTDTAIEFTRYTYPSWEMIDWSGEIFELPTKADSETQLQSKWHVGSYDRLILPVPEHWRPTFLEIKGLTPQDYSLIKRTDGTYFVTFREWVPTDNYRVKYGLIKSSNAEIPDPTADELTEMTEDILGDEDILPREVRDLLKDARKDLKKGKSNVEVAEKIERFVSRKGVYSLEDKYSNWFNNAPEGEYFKRVFERFYADCDVSNTALVALLRKVGIPARMAYGYANSQDMFNVGKQGKQLQEGENHGWVEVWDGHNWVTLDGTARRVDKGSLNFFELFNGGVNIEAIFEQSWLEEIAIYLEMLKDDPEAMAYILVSGPLLLFMVYVSILAVVSTKADATAKKPHDIYHQHLSSFLREQGWTTGMTQDVVNTTISSLSSHNLAERFGNHWYTKLPAILLNLTVVPYLVPAIKNIRLGRQLTQRSQEFKKEVATTGRKELDWSWDILTEVGGLTEERTTELLVRENDYHVAERCNDIVSGHINWMVDQLGIQGTQQVFINHLNHLGMKYENDPEGEEKFTEELLDTWYEAYLQQARKVWIKEQTAHLDFRRRWWRRSRRKFAEAVQRKLDSLPGPEVISPAEFITTTEGVLVDAITHFRRLQSRQQAMGADSKP